MSPSSPAGESPPDDDPLWDAYADTVITLDRTGEVLAGAADAVTDLPMASPVFVLTACNPYSVPTDAESNAAAHALLLAEVLQRGLPFLAVTGSSADGRWQEPSVALSAANGTDRTVIAAWAKSLGQHAFFECTDDHVRVIDAEGRLRRTTLRRRD